ncbi:MAG: hypothetical protein RL440_812 [Bacteroidota bacterium]
MKKRFTLLFLLASSLLFGQVCTIDNTQTQVGIYPNSMPNGVVGQAYSQDLTFVMPLDTLGYNFSNFQIVSVALPVGLSWACNNNATNCNYNPQLTPSGCVHIFGTPLLAGSYTIDVTVLADLSILSGYPFLFQLPIIISPSTTGISNNGFTSIGAPTCSPALVQFINNNPGLPYYNWDFGNGNFSNQEAPSPQYYQNPGTYLVQYNAYASLDTTTIFTLENLQITAMSNYGGGFPSYDNADSYFKLLQNGTVVYQSGIIGDQNPPLQWPLNINLNANSTYTIEIWEADASYAEPYFGNDDYIGSHALNLNGCNACNAGNASINYSIVMQEILPTPQITTIDTIVIYELPQTPLITYDSLSHTLSTVALGLAYQWYFNGSPISGATSATHTIFQSGNYTVVAINAQGCIAFSDTLQAVYCNPYVQAQLTETNGTLIVSNSAQNATYTWYLDGQLLANQQANTLTFQENGNYQCIVSDAFGCSDTTNLLLIEAGLASNSIEQPRLFPNPAKDALTISVPIHWLGAQLEISDLLGKVRYQSQLDNYKNAISLTDFQPGSYLIRLTVQDRQYQEMIFICSAQ